MGILLLLAALVAEPAPSVRSYYCTGTQFIGKSEHADTNVLTFRPDKLEFTVKTSHGKASGIGKSSPGLYRGQLVAGDGVLYAFNLDRYTGEFMLLVDTGEGASQGAVEFFGACRETRPKVS